MRLSNCNIFFVVAVYFLLSITSLRAQVQESDTIGYESEMRPIEGNSVDIEADLINSFPQPNSLMPQLKPQIWTKFKRKHYKEHGIAIGISYQGIVQHASQTVTGNQTAAGGCLILELV